MHSEVLMLSVLSAVAATARIDRIRGGRAIWKQLCALPVI